VLRRYLAGGDGQETGQARLRRQEIVVVSVQSIGRGVVPDVKELPPGIEEEREVEAGERSVEAVGELEEVVPRGVGSVGCIDVAVEAARLVMEAIQPRLGFSEGCRSSAAA
jgi:hypothetical protein